MSSAPKAVVVNVGTNHVRDKADPDVIVQKYSSIVDKLKKKFPKTKVVYSNIIPREDSEELQDTVEYVNAVANRRLKWDLTIRNAELYGGKLKAKDGIHLTTPGVSRLACNIRDSVLAALKLK